MPVGWAAEVEGGSPAGAAGQEPRGGFGFASTPPLSPSVLTHVSSLCLMDEAVGCRGVARSGRLRSRADRSKDLAASASPLHMATASPSRSLQFFTC
jgi:hypothetical protein